MKAGVRPRPRRPAWPAASPRSTRSSGAPPGGLPWAKGPRPPSSSDDDDGGGPPPPPLLPDVRNSLGRFTAALAAGEFDVGPGLTGGGVTVKWWTERVQSRERLAGLVDAVRGNPGPEVPAEPDDAYAAPYALFAGGPTYRPVRLADLVGGGVVGGGLPRRDRHRRPRPHPPPTRWACSSTTRACESKTPAWTARSRPGR